MSEKAKLLVLVHPGSCCGSANFNLGRTEGMNARVNLEEELMEWSGDLLIVHSDLSDEISLYRDFDRAIQNAKSKANVVKEIVDWDESSSGMGAATRSWLSKKSCPWKPGSTDVSLTGAWHHVDEEGGCVNSFRDLFQDMGFDAQILDSAVVLQ